MWKLQVGTPVTPCLSHVTGPGCGREGEKHGTHNVHLLPGQARECRGPDRLGLLDGFSWRSTLACTCEDSVELQVLERQVLPNYKLIDADTEFFQVYLIKVKTQP